MDEIHPVKFVGFRQIAYLPREEKWNGVDLGLSAALIKEPTAFASQYEVRKIWAPLHDGTIDTQNLKRSDCVKFCQIVEVNN